MDADTLIERVESDSAARWAMWVAWPLGVLLIVLIGRHQWFVRDDWAFVFTRQRIGDVEGFDSMLMTPQDGHWMLWPILVFRLLHAVFGTGSYLPYLIVLWATHIGIVLLAREWMRRFHVTAWITTLMTVLLLVFGAGWENLFFAVQIVYNFSLLAFLGQTLLVDHEGPVDRRDWIGAGISVIGVSSSGFGPFFVVGVGLLLVLRRRWWAAAVATVPQGLALGWWWLTWGDDPAGDAGTAGPRFVVRFVEGGITSTFGSLAGTLVLGGAGFVLCLAVLAWPKTSPAVRIPGIAMLATTIVMYAGIGLRREVFGAEAATWSRYQYMAAMLVAPTLAVGLDQAQRFASWARWVPRLLLLFAITRNVQWMDQRGGYWADVSGSDRSLFELVAGSEQQHLVPVDRSISPISPDVRVYDLPELVDDGAITPVPPETPEQRAIVAAALGLPDPVPVP